MLDKSILDHATRVELLKSAMDLSFKAKWQGERSEEWVKEAIAVLEEVPTLIVLLACYQEREKVLEILSGHTLPK